MMAAARVLFVFFAVWCVSAERVVLESSYDASIVPEGFFVVGEAPAHQEISLHFAIKQRNLDHLSTILEKVSDPQSSSYGKYLTWDAIESIIADPATLYHVRKWIESFDVTRHRVEGTGDWLVAKMTVAQAERLLETSFSVIKTKTGHEIIRALVPYSVPQEIADKLDFIGGVHGFVGLVSKAVVAGDKRKGRIATAVTPAVAKQQTFSMNTAGSNVNNSMAVAQFLNQYYSPDDLSQFQSENNLLNQAVAKVYGTNDATKPGVEAELDIEYIMAMGQNIVTWFVSTTGRHELQEPFLTWIENMEGDAGAPWLHSVSYGDKESSISLTYAQRCDVEFQKFGTTGRTIFFASGDDGVGCGSSSCTPNGNPVLEPNWPATSPYVTAVGGIELLSTGGLEGDRISSGGFSNYFTQASWQSSAVSAYLANATNIPTQDTFNSSGRAVPDIAAFSSNVRIVYKGRDEGVGGTSCASPTAAGLFALLNDVRLQNGMSTLGFLNPFIYQTAAAHADAFTDVTTGQNTDECCVGFKAATGWDPITGWGLPNYSALKNYVLSQ